MGSHGFFVRSGQKEPASGADGKLHLVGITMSGTVATGFAAGTTVPAVGSQPDFAEEPTVRTRVADRRLVVTASP